jgi:hypothetical protein
MKRIKAIRIFFLVIILVLALYWVTSIIEKNKISKNGVYVVAITTDISINKSGATVFFKYFYSNKEYRTSIKPGYSFNKKVGRKFFIKLLPDKPEKYVFLDVDVPECILSGKVDEVWKYLPSCQ